jgi:peptidyl-prolyl cis-trans isomerase D
MLKYMRTHATSWFIKILLVLIIVVFVLWGMGRIKSKEETIIATVGGDYITRVEFDRTYQDLFEYYTRIFGQQISPDLLKGLNIKQQALEQLINTAIIRQGIQEIGFRVSEGELRDAILQYPAFQRNGQFDRNLYAQFLGSTGLDEEKFQEMIHTNLMNQRMVTLIGDTGVVITETEAQELYFLENEQINLSFVKISPQAFTGRVPVTQGDLEEYYAEHGEEFRTPAQVTVRYLRFSPNAYLQEAEVSPQEVQEYYDMNIEQYQRPQKVRVRHILIGVSPEAGPDVVEQAQKKAEKVLAEARRDAQGANFAALARTYSDDPSASKGGDVGYFSRGEMDPALGEAVFALGKGEISPVVRTRYGFHVVKVEDVQEAKTKGLDEVKEEIISHVRREKAQDLAAIHAEDAAYQAKKEGGLQSYADETGLEVKEEGPFRAGEGLKGLGPSERFSSIAFTLDANEISSAFQDREDYFILQVVDKIPPQIPPLEEVRGQVQGALVSSMARGVAQGIAQDLFIAWKKGEGFGDLLRANGLTVKETGFFKRTSSSPPGIGPLGEHIGEVATLSPEVPWPDAIIEVNDIYVVVKLRDVKKVEEKEYEKAKDTYRKQLSGLKERALLEGWLAAMKKKVPIEPNQELLAQYR